MEAVPPIERIVSPQTAELSRRFNAASEAIASVATRGKGQIVAACQQGTMLGGGVKMAAMVFFWGAEIYTGCPLNHASPRVCRMSLVVSARDKLGPAAVPAAAAVTAAALGALILADSRKRKHRSKHDWRALCRASMSIPIPSL
ncbi:hypothetical protein FOZ63_001716, partial [Perkinsus olseni]